MIVGYVCYAFVFIGNHITKTVIYIIVACFVTVFKAFGIVGGVGYGLQLVCGVGICEVVNFYRLSQFFLSVTFQRGNVSVFIVAQVFGILSVTAKVYKKRWPTQCF